MSIIPKRWVMSRDDRKASGLRRPDVRGTGNARVLVQLPDVDREVFHLCRSHALAAETVIVRRRPKQPSGPKDGTRRKLRRPGIVRWLVKGTGSDDAPEDVDATAKRELITDTSSTSIARSWSSTTGLDSKSPRVLPTTRSRQPAIKSVASPRILRGRRAIDRHVSWSGRTAGPTSGGAGQRWRTISASAGSMRYRAHRRPR